jgi:hypothetical protein
MANLKVDLINKINNEKYFDELELVRLAQEPNMNFKIKINQMDELLDKIVRANSKMELIGHYFQEPAQTQPPTQQPMPQTRIHQGQSHGE